MSNKGTIRGAFRVSRSNHNANQNDGSKGRAHEAIITTQTLPNEPTVQPPEDTISKVSRKRPAASITKPETAEAAPQTRAKQQAHSSSMPPPPPPLDASTKIQIIDLLRGRILTATSSVASRNTQTEEPAKDLAGGFLGPMPLRPSLASAHDELVMLMDRVAKEEGMTASLLLLGERGVGKTLVVESALRTILSSTRGQNGQQVRGNDPDTAQLPSDKVIGVVRLSGLIHLDERLAFQEVARQLCDEFQQVFSRTASYDENLVFLRNMLQALHRCLKAVIFVIDELDAFTRRGKQTLLYNLLDTLAHSKVQACVIGVSSVVDVMDSMEKRVRSRFSHRRIVLEPPQLFEPKPAEGGDNTTLQQPSTSASAAKDEKTQHNLHAVREEETPLGILCSILTLPTPAPMRASPLFPPHAIEAHNSSVRRSLDDLAVKTALSQSFNVKLRPSDLVGIAQRALQLWAIDLVPSLPTASSSSSSAPASSTLLFSPSHLLRAIQDHQATYASQVSTLVDCSVLQMFLIVAMHRMTTTKGLDTCNFEMAFDEMRRSVMFHAGAGVGGAEQYKWSKAAALRAFQGLVGNGVVVYSSAGGERHAGRGSSFIGAELRAGRATLEAAMRLRGDEGCPELLSRFWSEI